MTEDRTVDDIERRFDTAIAQIEKGLRNLRMYSEELFAWDEWDEEDYEMMRIETERIRDNADMIYRMFSD